MPTFNETLDALDQELSLVLKEDNSVPMTQAELVAYVQEQVELAKADADPSERLIALREVVSLAKAYGWESNDTMSVAVFSGPLSVQAQSAQAEKIAEHPGKSLPTAPGQEASPSSGAFEAPSGPTGPAGNTARPAASHMPPTFPQAEPAASSEGFIAKAEDKDLLDAMHGMLDDEGKAHKEEVHADLKDEVKKDDGWPLDLSTESFLERKPEVPAAEDFGSDPDGLGRGKVVKD